MGFPKYMGDPNMARVHKFMVLDTNEVGYFISQVGAAAASFGVASSDISIVAGALMQYFGYRCTPPENIVYGPQLDSICLDPSCPLDPNPVCGQYGAPQPPPMVAPQCASSSMAGKYSSTSSSTYAKTSSSEYSKSTKTSSSKYSKSTTTSSSAYSKYTKA